jgi:hypothetical protein
VFQAQLRARGLLCGLVVELRDCDEAKIREMRPLTRNFSGYTFPDRIPDDDPWVGLWRKCTKNQSRRFLFQPLALPGEIGPVIRGVIVNHDTYVYQERINLLLKAGEIQRIRWKWTPTIIEVGDGYGALALALTSVLRRAQYVICDIPESLLFSGLYLALAGKSVKVFDGSIGRGITLVPNYMLHRLLDPVIEVDLAINALNLRNGNFQDDPAPTRCIL